MKNQEKKPVISPQDFEELLAKAKAGDVEAQRTVAGCYRNGEGVEQNAKSAYNWYKKAAEQGDAFAQNALGACYEVGAGIKQDINKAFTWYEEARKNGSAAAWCNLGLCYLHGLGTMVDKSKAFQYFDISLKKGYGRTLIVLAKCYLEGDGCDRDVKKARKYIKQAAKDPKLVQELADEGRKLFDRGGYSFARPNDYANAVELSVPAAKAGNGKAYYTLSKAYISGKGVATDTKKSMKYMQLASKAGYAEAHNTYTYVQRRVSESLRQAKLAAEEIRRKEYEEVFYRNTIARSANSPQPINVTATPQPEKPKVDPDADTLYHVETKVSVRYYNEHEGFMGLKVYDADADATFYYESKSGRTATRSTSVRFSNVQYNSVSVSDVEYRCSSYLGKY